MGISGLLPMLKDISEEIHIGSFAGQVAAIDAYCWIHKAALLCAEELILGTETSRYVELCMKNVDLLLTNGVRPIMVFDGFSLDAKGDVESARRRNREESVRRGLALWTQGQKEKARDEFKKSVDVTNEMALKVIEACREKKIHYVVAPFEADAQLTFLNVEGFADFVISEDSDLLVFGCEQVFYKMGPSGTGKLIKKNDINKCLKIREYTFEKFRHMCILSGCDYARSIKGVGLQRAKKVVEMAGDRGMEWAVQNIREILKKPSLIIPDSYYEKFSLANNTFQHQSVFDPLSRKVVPLSGDVSNEYVLSRCQPTDEFATNTAIGNINVQTGERVRNFPLPGAEIELIPLTSSTNREADTTAHVNIDKASESEQVKIIGVEQGTFVWTIPCLPVLAIEWRKAKISQNGLIQKALFRASDHRVLQVQTPVCLTMLSSCSLEIDNEKYTVIWDFTVTTDNDHAASAQIELDDDIFSLEDDSLMELNCQDTSDDDDENSEEALVLHTLPFKVMGVAHKVERQNHLELAFKKKEKENIVIQAKVEPEPDNMFDANAIRVLIDYGLGFKHVGYIAQELTKFIHPVIKQRRLQHTSVYDIKFRTAWAKTGYYLTLQLTSKGEWPSQVLRASARVQ